MQGKNINIIKFVDALKAFKLTLSNGNKKFVFTQCFEKLDKLLAHRENGPLVHIKSYILEHPSSLESEFEKYFPEISHMNLILHESLSLFPLKKFQMNTKTNF